MAGTQRPDIVVGIDIGQTCSGVAYSLGPDWSQPQCLNQWPSANGFEKADKVATRVGYSKNRNELKNWGFESSFEDESTNVRAHFKLTLDEEWVDDRGFSCHEARQWYFDYLKCLHREIETYFDAHVPRWRLLRVEYNFSAPTTWRSPAMISIIETMIREAGFCSTQLQTVRMSLTEAEAAAIDASGVRYSAGDIFLICDAGGGTTDVNLLRVTSTEGVIQLEPLDHVEGAEIGSTLIDFRMTKHIKTRLEPIVDRLQRDLDAIVHEMLQGKFMTIKHSFPAPRVEQFWLDVKGLAGAQTFEECGIIDSRMSIKTQTLQAIFDEQLEGIFELLDDRLHQLTITHPNEQVSYIILSGGLGSSPYLYQELRNRYELNSRFKSINTASLRIMKVPSPQLAVVKGLVRERIQQLGNTPDAGQEVFRTRRCRNSYGVVVRVPYDEALHHGLPISTDPNDGGRWVDQLVDWFIKQGEEIDVEQGVRRQYGATMSEQESTNQRFARIVMSRNPYDQLPRRKTDPGCEELVVVKYWLTPNDMKLKNRQVWKLKKKYYRADFTFVVKPGASDLRFQILGRDGLISSDQNKMEIEFMDPGEQRSGPRPPAKAPFTANGAAQQPSYGVRSAPPNGSFHSSAAQSPVPSGSFNGTSPQGPASNGQFTGPASPAHGSMSNGTFSGPVSAPQAPMSNGQSGFAPHSHMRTSSGQALHTPLSTDPNGAFEGSNGSAPNGMQNGWPQQQSMSNGSSSNVAYTPPTPPSAVLHQPYENTLGPSQRVVSSGWPQLLSSNKSQPQQNSWSPR